MGYIRVTVQMTEEEVAKLDKAAEVLATRQEGLRPNRANVVRTGALRYANELLGNKPKEDR